MNGASARRTIQITFTRYQQQQQRYRSFYPVSRGRPVLVKAATTAHASTTERYERRWIAERSSNDVNNEAKPSLKETVERLRNESKGSTSTDPDAASNDAAKSTSVDSGDVFRRAADLWDGFRSEVSTTWQDLVKSGERQSINKKIVLHPTETAGGNAPYTGPASIMVVDPQLTAWERMQKRLESAPIIMDILERTSEVYEKSGAKAVKQRVDNLKEDAREAWETSQNPWVYRLSSVYDTVTAESSETRAVVELRVLDPSFTVEGWRQDVVEHTLPVIMAWFLEGRINQLKPWLGESVFKRLAAEMAAREKEGVQVDAHVLAIMNSEIIAIEFDEVNRGSPIILLHFMCQQINCVRKKETNEIVEGSEDDIRANSYVVAFQREYRETTGELIWKIIDFRFNGAIAYL